MQAQTLKLMRDLTEKHHTAVLFISHNLGVVREFADRVYVIYKGRIGSSRGSTAAAVRRPAPSLYAGAFEGRAAHHRRRHSRDRGRIGKLFRAAGGA